MGFQVLDAAPTKKTTEIVLQKSKSRLNHLLTMASEPEEKVAGTTRLLV
jgi:hypothetical protein